MSVCGFAIEDSICVCFWKNRSNLHAFVHFCAFRRCKIWTLHRSSYFVGLKLEMIALGMIEWKIFVFSEHIHAFYNHISKSFWQSGFSKLEKATELLRGLQPIDICFSRVDILSRESLDVQVGKYKKSYAVL